MAALYYVQAIFTVWMLVDAVRRRSPYYWYVVLFFPFGPLVYFLAVKIDDYDLRWLKRLVTFERAPALDALRHEFQQAPSFANRIRLAAALHDTGELAESAELYEGALATHPNDAEALFGLGRVRMALGEAGAAIEPLGKLFQLKPSYLDYEAAVELAHALVLEARDEDAIAVLEDVVRASPRAPHAVLLAERLVAAGRLEEAKKHLERALGDHEHSPPFIRRRDRSAASAARDLLGRLAPR